PTRTSRHKSTHSTLSLSDFAAEWLFSRRGEAHTEVTGGGGVQGPGRKPGPRRVRPQKQRTGSVRRCYSTASHRQFGSGSWLQRADDEGVALTAAAAQRGRAGAAPAALQLMENGEGQPGARHPDRVTQGDGTTVHVHDVVAEAQLVHRSQTDGGEGLVELEQVDVA